MNKTEKKLRNTLKANALFSLVSGISLLVLKNPIATLMNQTNLIVFTIIGFGLISFSGFVMATAFQKKANPTLVKSIIIQDWVWVFVSALILFLNPFSISIMGNTIIALVALIVMTFAIFQLKYLKGMIQEIVSF